MKRLLAFTFLICFAVFLGARAGSFLIIDQPRPSDVIVVLAGETNRRPERALRLLSQGYARRIVLDVPTNSKIYEFTQLQLAQQYIRDLQQGSSVSVCPIEGLSTKAESRDVATCLAREDGKSVLLVTSDFHTRRALSVFRRELPQYAYSVAASRDDEQFGAHWWIHRQWAKTLVDEWLRLFWWKCVDQWRQ
ncbi:MAG: YdcF family protein [Candidatus Sulfotelmatobacter sp.]